MYAPAAAEATLEYASMMYVSVSMLITTSVIAIHGKGAHPAQTWSALVAPGRDPHDPANYVTWLDQDNMLPAALPSARIIRYGYLSEWFGENAVKTRAASIGEKFLDELNGLRVNAPERPLVFIGHSFGGLVILKVSSREYFHTHNLRVSDYASGKARRMAMARYIRIYGRSCLSWNSVPRYTRYASYRDSA